MQAMGFDDERLAREIGVARETVNRYRHHPHRLNSTTMADIAVVLGISPGDLWRLPSRPSVDAILQNTDEATHQSVWQAVRALIKDRQQS